MNFRVGVLGSRGMLGHMVTRVLSESPVIDVVPLSRKDFEVRQENLNALGTKLGHFGPFDYVVNCIGAIKPVFNDPCRVRNAIYTNAVFPHQLALWGDIVNTKVIHITTDCVFSGKLGCYTEESPHDALDAYGKSKSLGEPDTLMCIRTSIIGPEVDGKGRSFLEWLKSSRGKEVSGYSNHYWNGLTTTELAYGLCDIIESDVWEPGLFHVFGEDVTKYDMICEINKQYNLCLRVNEIEVDEPVDRTLRTTKDLCDFLRPISFADMITNMLMVENE